MTAILDKANPTVRKPTEAQHSAQARRLRTLMSEASAIREKLESGEIDYDRAAAELSRLKSRHRSLFQRLLGR